jgi:hypothetical protein
MAKVDFTDAAQYDRLQRAELNVELNELIERIATATPRLSRGYLGASAAGSECMRKVEFDWQASSVIGAKQRRRFDRGHAIEATMREQLAAAGFTFAPQQALEFQALDYLQGHADGLIMDAPAPIKTFLELPTLWECKCLYAKGWRDIVRHGLAATYPVYAGQVCLYQHFLNRPNPVLFTAVNADSAEAVHFLVPFDQERLERTLERITLIIEATREGRLLERAYHDPNDWHCVAQCGHHARCWKLPP